eukprot:gene6096-biopygen3902
MGLIGGTVGAIIFTALEVVVLALTVIGTPIQQFKPKYGGNHCFTLWGYKADCGSTTYTIRGKDAFGCAQRKNNMVGAAVFAIASIVFSLILVLYGVMVILHCCTSFLLPVILSILTAGTLLVCWACVAGVFNNRMCKHQVTDGKYKEWYDYGAGFALIVVAWCVQVVNVVFAFVMMCC